MTLTRQRPSAGLANRYSFQAATFQPTFYLSAVDLSAIVMSEDYGPDVFEHTSGEVPSYVPIGIRVQRSGQGAESCSGSVVLAGLDVHDQPQHATIPFVMNGAARALIAYATEVFSRLDAIRVHVVSAAAGDVLDVGFPCKQTTPQPTGTGPTLYSSSPSMPAGISFEIPYVLRSRWQLGSRRVIVQLDTTAGATNHLLEGDLCVVSDAKTRRVYTFRAVPVGPFDLLRTGTPAQVRDRLIEAIVADTSLAAIPIANADASGTFTLHQVGRRFICQILRPNGANLDAITNVTPPTSRLIDFRASSVGVTANTVSAGDCLIISDRGGSDIYEFGAAPAAGHIGVAIGASLAATLDNLEIAVNTNGGALTHASIIHVTGEGRVFLVHAGAEASIQLWTANANVSMPYFETTSSAVPDVDGSDQLFGPMHLIECQYMTGHVAGVLTALQAINLLDRDAFSLSRSRSVIAANSRRGQPVPGSTRAATFDNSPVALPNVPTAQLVGHGFLVCTDPSLYDLAAGRRLHVRPGLAESAEDGEYGWHGGVRGVSGSFGSATPDPEPRGHHSHRTEGRR